MNDLMKIAQMTTEEAVIAKINLIRKEDEDVARDIVELCDLMSCLTGDPEKASLYRKIVNHFKEIGFYKEEEDEEGRA